MRVTSKGQVTIPIDIRERYGFLPDTEIEFVPDHEGVRLVRATSDRPDRGSRVIDRLRGSASTRLSTDEIMKLTRGS